MSASLVCDASAVVALLLNAGPHGRWVTEALSEAHLAAPSLMTCESANIIRRHKLAGMVHADQAAQAHVDLLDLAIEHWPYALLGHEGRQLRHALTSYDASYVVLAELLGGTLVTLDRRIGGSPGLECAIATP